MSNYPTRTELERLLGSMTFAPVKDEKPITFDSITELFDKFNEGAKKAPSLLVGTDLTVRTMNELPINDGCAQYGIPVHCDPWMPRGFGVLKHGEEVVQIWDMRTDAEKAEDAARYVDKP